MLFTALTAQKPTLSMIAPMNNTSYYFDRLETLQIIEKHYPALADPARSKQTRYQIRDRVFRFYGKSRRKPRASARGGCQFRYPYRRGGQYELYSENTYTDLIEPEPPEFVSETFESPCHQAVPALYTDYQLRQVPSQWWYKSREVDVVAPTDESTLIAGKAKFTTTPFLIP